MTQWEVLLVIIVVLELIVLVIDKFVNPANKKNLENVQVIQQNTDAINNLTEKIGTLTTGNQKDHDKFYKSINNLEQDVAVLKEKHNSDVRILQEQIRKD